MTGLRHAVEELLRAYAAVLFCSSRAAGGVFLAVTWTSPRVGAAGLLALSATALWSRALALGSPASIHLVNGLLTGLLLGAFYPFGPQLVAGIAALSLVVALASQWLSAALWRAGALPLFSLPFVVASWLALLVVPAYGVAPQTSADAGAVALFLTSLGWLFLTPDPLAGAALFAGLALGSRYLALLAVAGYLSGHAALWLVGVPAPDAAGFNFMLTAMAVGGFFCVPGALAFVLALAAAALTALTALALKPALGPLHLPLLTLPFIAVAWLFLGALGSRSKDAAPRVLLEEPDVPERSYERTRIARVRGSAPGAVALLAPFYGEWRVSQSFAGAYTHKHPWQHALDFDIVESGASRRGETAAAGDFLCFGVPVLAPAAAQVVALRDDLPDVAPGEADIRNNWGNFLMLRTQAGHHVLLAHLRQGSSRVSVGDWVIAGQPLAACGSSGRAPEPHLHLQVQPAPQLGTPTRSFHLANVLVRRDGAEAEFRLCCVPAEGDLVSAAPRDESLARALRLPEGRVLVYAMRGGAGEGLQTLRVERTLLGQSRLAADSGASAAFEESPYAIGWFDRRGGGDRLLDMWQLSLGLTPMSAAAGLWRDRPPLALLPLAAWQRALAALARPLGGGCLSTYRRRWDEASGSWRQEAEHVLRPLPGVAWRVATCAWLSPEHGITRLQMNFAGRRWEAALQAETGTANRPTRELASA